MIRIFVADDHDIVRTGLKRIFAELPDIAVCGEAASADELLAQVPAARPDVVVLDVHMPGCHGPHVIESLAALPHPPRVVVFTMYAEDGHAVPFLRSGAGAFINKRRSAAELVAAIRKVHAGGRYITPELADYLFEQQIDVHKAPHETLSQRELAVVRGLAGGKRAVEVAAELGLSASTVNTFVQRIKTKLGVRTVVEIVEFARTYGLLG